MTFRTIMVGVDGSTPARSATEIAADIAKQYGAKVILVHVVSPRPIAAALEGLVEYQRIEHLKTTEGEALRSLGERILQSAEARLREAGVEQVETLVEVGDPATTIAAAAKACEADLIVIGRRGLGDLAALMMGSVSHKLIQLADRPCLTVG